MDKKRIEREELTIRTLIKDFIKIFQVFKEKIREWLAENIFYIECRFKDTCVHYSKGKCLETWGWDNCPIYDRLEDGD